MNRIRTYQQYPICDSSHDLYFISNIDVESSQHLFSVADPDSPDLRIEIEATIPVQSYATYLQCISDLLRYGKFVSDCSGAKIHIPNEQDLRATFSGAGVPTYKFIGLDIKPEELRFALLDRIRYWEFWDERRRANDLDNDEEIPANYGVWLEVPLEGVKSYDFHIFHNTSVIIRPRADFIEITESEKHIRYYGDHRSFHTDRTFYNISRIRDERNRAVVNIKEIRS